MLAGTRLQEAQVLTPGIYTHAEFWLRLRMLHTQVVRFFFKQIVTFYFAWISKLSTACGGSVAGRAGHAGDPVCVPGVRLAVEVLTGFLCSGDRFCP